MPVSRLLHRPWLPFAGTLCLLAMAACDRSPESAPAPAPAESPATSTAPVPEAARVPAAAKQDEDPGRYTSLGGGDCEVTEVDEESGGSTSRCPGLDGYALMVLDGDARMSIDVVAPDGSRHPLDLWTIASGAFSSLGPRAEWRYPDGATSPGALIVRYEAYEFPEQPERSRSYLVVARLDGDRTCLVAKLAPGPRQNLLARAEAERVRTATCLAPPT